jgi:hypothetical protein
MKNFLNTKLSFFKSRFEFTTSLSLTTCENRLEDLGASIHEGKPAGNPPRRTSSGFLLQYSRKPQVMLHGKLEEVEEGTLVSAEYYAHKIYFNYIGFIFLFLYSIYSKLYYLTFFSLVWALINTAYIQSYRSSWQYLESKVTKSLNHWKKQ